jgi:hypothetical protein
VILAAINPDNTAAGYNWTFAYPMLLFIVIGGVLWYLFGRPHRRVPPRPISASAGSRQPDPSAARAAAVAGGLSVAAGGGTTESPAEPQGARLAADADAGSTGPDSATAADATAGETAPGYTATGGAPDTGTADGGTTEEDTGAQE